MRRKILFLSADYPSEDGGHGIGSAVASLAPGLAARGHQVHVLSCRSHQATRDEIDADVRVHRRPTVRLPGLRRALGPHAAWRIEAALATYRESRRLGVRFDVVEGPDWGATGLLFALRPRAALVTYLHTPLPLIRRFNGLATDRSIRWATMLERFTVRRSALVIASAPILVEELARIGWITPRDVDIIPCAVDWQKWCGTCPARDTGRRVLFVGRLEARKAPEILVAAMHRLVSDVAGVEAIFVGDSAGERNGVAYRTSLEREARGASCVFVDHLPRHRLIEHLNEARVVAIPSRFESFSMVAAEAMAARRPVVVTTTTGIAELVRTARAGVVVSPEDARALASALRSFLVSPDTATEAGERGRRAVMEYLDPERIGALREAAYERAIARRT